MDLRPQFDTSAVADLGRYVAPLSAVPATPRAEIRSRSPTIRSPPSSSSGESGDAEEVLTVSHFEYIDIPSGRYHRLLLRQDGMVRMLSYCGSVRDSTWHGWWAESPLGHLDVYVSYRGIHGTLICIHPPQITGAGLRTVFCEGRLKAIVAKVRE